MYYLIEHEGKSVGYQQCNNPDRLPKLIADWNVAFPGSTARPEIDGNCPGWFLFESEGHTVGRGYCKNRKAIGRRIQRWFTTPTTARWDPNQESTVEWYRTPPDASDPNTYLLGPGWYLIERDGKIIGRKWWRDQPRLRYYLQRDFPDAKAYPDPNQESTGAWTVSPKGQIRRSKR